MMKWVEAGNIMRDKNHLSESGFNGILLIPTMKATSEKPLLGPGPNWTTFGTGGFRVTESDVAGHFESYKARILPLYVQRASMCGINLD